MCSGIRHRWDTWRKGCRAGKASGRFKQIPQVSVWDQANIFAAPVRIKHFVLHLVDNVTRRGKNAMLFFHFLLVPATSQQPHTEQQRAAASAGTGLWRAYFRSPLKIETHKAGLPTWTPKVQIRNWCQWCSMRFVLLTENSRRCSQIFTLTPVSPELCLKSSLR